MKTYKADQDDQVDAVAAEVLEALCTRRPVEPFSRRHPTVNIEPYAVTAALRRRLEASGERIVGRKIGFTNRTMWAEYGVYAPIWGYMRASSVHDLADVSGRFSLAPFVEPRIEPEIVFQLRRAPEAGMTDRALAECIEWFGHGFEIVQSVYPSWSFTGFDTIAANGLHGALLMGERLAVRGREAELASTLVNFDVNLLRSGTSMDRGNARNVLDGPLSTLSHLAALLQDDQFNPPLSSGEIVSTGTLTRALPVQAGETWSTILTGIQLDGIAVTFT